MTVFRKTNWSARKSIIAYVQKYAQKYAFEHEDANENKEKEERLLVDGASDWLQIWTAESSIDVKGNKAIKKKFVFLANRLVYLNTVTYTHT